jgi:hypothetical protein
MREFLAALGISKRDIAWLALWVEQQRRQGLDPSQPAAPAAPDYHPSVNLPDEAQPLAEWAIQGCQDRWFRAVVRHLGSRGDVAIDATTYYWTPSTFRHLNRYLIIPCYQDYRVVGWTARSVDDKLPRYLKSLPANYLFNAQFLTWPKRQYVFIVEGVFDALVLDGVGLLGGSLNDRQISWIKRTDKQPVVVPDRDTAGGYLIEIAIQQQWPVATPYFGRHQWWDADVKDAAEAVKRYGKQYTVQSILATQCTHAGEIRLRTSYRATSMR